jgi:RNA polymerase sigma factor (sigma-70 family)
MGNQGAPSTRATLLGRLCRQGPIDESAWSEFVSLYSRPLYKWCHHWGLQDADAEDVAQQVLLRLAEKMRDFVYDPALSFRAWLKTVAHHAWRDWADSRQRLTSGSGDSTVLEHLVSLPARMDLLQRLNEEYDRELLEHAVALVRLRVAPHTWEAFRLTALENVSAVEAARQLNLQIANVYQAKSTVRKMLQEETQRLEGTTT